MARVITSPVSGPCSSGISGCADCKHVTFIAPPTYPIVIEDWTLQQALERWHWQARSYKAFWIVLGRGRGGDGQLFGFVYPNVHFTWLCPCWMFPPCAPQSSMPAIMTMLADHAARQLLDFNQKLDINLLDNVVNCLYHGVGPQVRKTISQTGEI